MKLKTITVKRGKKHIVINQSDYDDTKYTKITSKKKVDNDFQDKV